jgi:hypothetical protein
VRPPRTVPGLRALEGVTVKLAGTVTDTRDTRERERETVLVGTIVHNGGSRAASEKERERERESVKASLGTTVHNRERERERELY